MKPAKLFVFVVTLLVMLVLSTNSWAAFEAHPRFTLGEEYNDNIFLDSSGREESDWISTIQPGLNLTYDGSSLNAIIDYSMRFRYYINNSDENEDRFKEVQRGTARLFFFSGRPFTLRLSETVSSAVLDDRQNNADYNEVQNRSVLYHSTVTPEFHWKLTRTFSMVFGYIYDRNDYVDSRGNDTESHEGHFSLVKQISAISEVYARFSYLDHDSDDVDDVFKQQTYTLGINQQLGKRISGTIEGGVSKVDQKTDSTLTNSNWLVDLSYHYSAPITFTLAFSQDYRVTPQDGLISSQQASVGAHYGKESLTASSSIFWNKSDYKRESRQDEWVGIRFDLSRPLAKNLTANFNTEYRHSKYTDPTEEVDLYTLGGSLAYTYRRFLVRLGYIFRNSDSDLRNGGYTNNVLSLNGTMNF